MKFRLSAAILFTLALAAPGAAQTYRDSGGSIVPGAVPIKPSVGPMFQSGVPGYVECAPGSNLCGAVAPGSNAIGSVAPIGAANMAGAHVTGIGTGSASVLAAARTGVPGTGRAAITVVNSGTVILCVAATSIATCGTNPQLAAGASITLQTQSAVYGLAATGTGVADVWETY